MKKDELIGQALEAVRTKHGRTWSLSDMEAAVSAFCEVAAAELLGGGSVPLPGIGKLKIRQTSARAGRNPRTGAAIEIPAGQKVVFIPGKEFKDAFRS